MIVSSQIYYQKLFKTKESDRKLILQRLLFKSK